MSDFTASGFPVHEQVISAVSPVGSVTPAFAPAANSFSTIGALESVQARDSGVTPYSLAALTFAPDRINRSAISKSFQCAAQCSTVAPSACVELTSAC